MDELLALVSVAELVGLPFEVSGPTLSTGVPPELREALFNLTEHIEANPRDAEARYRRGAVLQSLQHHAAAYTDLCEALRLAPDHARAWLLLSEVLHDLKHYEHARTARQRAMEIDPAVAQ